MSQPKCLGIRGALVFIVLLLGAAADAAAPGPPTDLTARGLDLFLHLPTSAAPRALLPVQVVALGFPTAVSVAPLASVVVEAAWDPEHLGPHVAAAPPPVRATTDAAGRAHLDVPVPDGDARELSLLVGVRSGARQRTRPVAVQRVRPNEVVLYVADRRVVPGSVVSAWALVTRATTGEPVAKEPVTVTLNEGGLSRFTTQVTTDNAGTASLRIPIPRTTEPAWEWKLIARTMSTIYESGAASVTLVPREETPGSPRLFASWALDAVHAGDAARWVVRVRDASDAPVAGATVRTWVGPKGTSPPSYDAAGEWEKGSTPAVTNAAGEVVGGADAPSVVAGVGTTLRLVARTIVDGYDIEDEATVRVGAAASTAELLLEAGAIVPGIEQRMLLRVRDGKGSGVSAGFVVEADGLRARVTTDAQGEAEVTWHPPRDVGAARKVGPCAGGVAAAVVIRPEGAVAALGPRSEPFEECVAVDRDAAGIVRAEPSLVRAGDRVRVRVAVPDGAPNRSDPWSVVLRSDSSTEAISAWATNAEQGAEVVLPETANGLWSVSAASPGRSRAARVAGSAVLARPRILPRLVGRVVGGRAAPGGTIDVEAVLTDGTGHPLVGAVSAVMIDGKGGGSLAGLERLDTRSRLCGDAGVDPGRCDAFIEGDPALEPLRRALIGTRGGPALAPVNDPSSTMQEELRNAFRGVVHSLEGAVFESTNSADQLRDARRRSQGAWAFNPELLTLVTAAMDPRPTTPGGEPLTLADLLAIDPQVTFDNVARRVTRLKLFRILAEVRSAKRERGLDADEPALREPNALLRRLVRESRIPESLLLDPWGGTIQFVRRDGPGTPFLTAVRGFELRAPGPDGIVGDADDVRDPFERVLRPHTPYAAAVDEDRLVDARYDMEVGDATVSAWTQLFSELTGDTLGAGGLGMSGVGEGGGGLGRGVGLGEVGTVGNGRGSASVPMDVQFWSPPQRTDAGGRATLHVPLGDIETTWRIALIAIPDAAMPATTAIDVPVALSLSARVDTGAVWVAGDVLETRVTVRNRTSKPVRANVTLAVDGVATLFDPRGRERAVDVPPGGATVLGARVRADGPGGAGLVVTTRAQGLPDDVVRHHWEVRPAGDTIDLTHAEWMVGEVDLSASLDRGLYRPLGAARLVLERGEPEALAAALEAVDPDKPSSPSAMADAVEVAARVRAWALPLHGQADPMVLRAVEVAHRAIGRLAAYEQVNKAVRWSTIARARAFALGNDGDALSKPSDCPPEAEPSRAESPMALADSLDAEPPPRGGTVAACWDAYVSNAMEIIEGSKSAPILSRALLALADRPHRAAQALGAAARLRHLVRLGPAGGVVGPGPAPLDRASRALLYAGLLRAATMDRAESPNLPKLVAWMLVQRDGEGGFGSPLATRAAVRALLAMPSPAASVGRALAVTIDEARRSVQVGSDGVVVFAVPTGTRTLRVDTHGQGVVARLVRPVLRAWSQPAPLAAESPLRVDVTWPGARAGRAGALLLKLQHDLSHTVTADVTLPLPPGVTLAQPVTGVRQVQGALAIRRVVEAGGVPLVFEVPLRFALPGRVTVPEAIARIVEEDAPVASAPARPLRIE